MRKAVVMERRMSFRESDTAKRTHLKEPLEVFHSTESSKEEIWEANPNLERGRAISPGIEKMLA